MKPAAKGNVDQIHQEGQAEIRVARQLGSKSIGQRQRRGILKNQVIEICYSFALKCTLFDSSHRAESEYVIIFFVQVGKQKMYDWLNF
jgi:hypothetical protein